MHFLHPMIRRQLALVYLGVVSLLLLAVSGVAAFANHYIASYDLYDTTDHTYGPNFGQIWSGNIISGAQYAQAENWNMSWTQDAATNLHLNMDHLGPIFHAFKYDPTNPNANCAAGFSYDGYWETNWRNAWVVTKNATCSGGITNVNNEIRVYTYASEIVYGNSYYGGAEFKATTPPSYTSKVSNDIYFNNIWEKKDPISNGTWCFNNVNGNIWSC